MLTASFIFTKHKEADLLEMFHSSDKQPLDYNMQLVTKLAHYDTREIYFVYIC